MDSQAQTVIQRTPPYNEELTMVSQCSELVLRWIKANYPFVLIFISLFSWHYSVEILSLATVSYFMFLTNDELKQCIERKVHLDLFFH
jgi:hypothetical protein